MSREGRESQRETEHSREIRRNRVPMGGQRQKLARAEIPGYHQRWIDGTPGRLADAERAGYEFVMIPDPDGGGGEVKEQMVVGTLPGGKPHIQYRMKQKAEFYHEDQELKLDNIRRVERTIKHGAKPLSDPNKQRGPQDSEDVFYTRNASERALNVDEGLGDPS